MPRLVYADWLDENGDVERAEFIRVQIGLSRCAHTFEPEAIQLAARQKEIWDANGERFKKELPVGFRYSGLNAYQRGFFSHVTSLATNWTNRSDRIDGILIEGLTLTDTVPPKKPFFDSDSLATVKVLDLSRMQCDDDVAESLANSSTLNALRSLTMNAASVTDVGLGCLANPRGAWAMVNLCLQSINRVSTKGFASIFQSPAWATLKRFEFSGQNLRRLGDSFADAISQSPVILEKLKMSWAMMTDAGLETLTSTKRLGRLIELSLPGNRISSEGMRLLGDVKSFSELILLDLSGNPIGSGGSTFLSQIAFPKLRNVDLAGCQIGPAGVAAILRSGMLRIATHLCLHANVLGSNGATELGNSKSLEYVQTLSLWSNEIGDAGAVAIANARSLERLTELSLNFNQIGDEGALAIAKAKSLSGLKELSLNSNQIGDEGAMAIATSKVLANVEIIRLGGNKQISRKARKTIRSACGERINLK